MSVISPDDCATKLSDLPGPHEWIVRPFEIESLDWLIKTMLTDQQGRD